MAHTEKTVTWILRIAVAGEFVGHGMFALQGKEAWIGWINQFLGYAHLANPVLAAHLLTIIGATDLLVALIILFRPVKAVLLWASVWGFWTALVRPIVGEPVWDFIERWSNWGAPLALLLLQGCPKQMRDWFKS